MPLNEAVPEVAVVFYSQMIGNLVAYELWLLHACRWWVNLKKLRHTAKSQIRRSICCCGYEHANAADLAYLEGQGSCEGKQPFHTLTPCLFGRWAYISL